MIHVSLTCVLRHRTRQKIIRQVCGYKRSAVFGHRPDLESTNYQSINQLKLTQLKPETNNYAAIKLVDEYKKYGHYLALESINPLKSQVKEIDPRYEGTIKLIKESISELKNQVNECDSIQTNGLITGENLNEKITGNQLIKYLESKYGESSPISIEFMHIPSVVERDWIAKEYESLNRGMYKNFEKLFAQIMIESEVTELFMGKKFPSVKRYSGEGSESMNIFFHQLFHDIINSSINYPEIFIGMAHRGRLPFLIQQLNFPPGLMFRKMAGKSEIDLNKYPNSTGDVLSHLYISSDISKNVLKDESLQVTLFPNPSHLEAVSPVTMGAARAASLKHKCSNYSSNYRTNYSTNYSTHCNQEKEGNNSYLCPLPVQVHGDGSFSGQGIMMETMAMSRLPHFNCDGSIHLIINNQLAYTAPGGTFGRSSFYASDLMKMIDSLVIHVNGSDPIAVAQSASLASKYRQIFRKDICIDMICYRKHGHNELDDPTFTNPIMYEEINHLPVSLPERYGRKVLEEDEYQSIKKNYQDFLNEEYKLSQSDSFIIPDCNFQSSQLERASKELITTWNTGVDVKKLKLIGLQSINLPNEFSLHPTVKKSLIDPRRKMIESGDKIDWSTAESLAIGSLMREGFNVRLVGQDVGRGTFSQRHVMMTDQLTGDVIIPINEKMINEDDETIINEKTNNERNLNTIKGNVIKNENVVNEEIINEAGKLEVVNSHLSEEAVLAYEYGYSLINPEKNLSIWEAQFGDFFNGAQIIIDTMVSSGELKWTLQSNLVLLLPHGYDGTGPEHSSCHIERFLQMSDSSFDSVDGDDVNMVIVNPSTPAQYFHLLRRQMIRPFKKPLIVASPKILWRHPMAVSNFSDFSPMKYFLPVIDDPGVATDPASVEKIIFCSGKHYYALNQERREKGCNNVAIVRIEELCPFPAAQLIQVLNRYQNGVELIWSQEEHMNMGPWIHVSTRFDRLLKRELKYVGRGVLGSPATGIGSVHKQEAMEVIKKSFE